MTGDHKAIFERTVTFSLESPTRQTSNPAPRKPTLITIDDDRCLIDEVDSSAVDRPRSIARRANCRRRAETSRPLTTQVPAYQAPSPPAQATKKDARHPRPVHGLFRGRDARAPLRAMRRGAPRRRTRRTRRRRAFSHPQPREDGGRPSGGFLDDRRRASLPLRRRRPRSSARVFKVRFADRIRRRLARVFSIAAPRFKTSPAAIPVSHRRPRHPGFPPVDRRPPPPDLPADPAI